MCALNVVILRRFFCCVKRRYVRNLIGVRPYCTRESYIRTLLTQTAISLVKLIDKYLEKCVLCAPVEILLYIHLSASRVSSYCVFSSALSTRKEATTNLGTCTYGMFQPPCGVREATISSQGPPPSAAYYLLSASMTENTNSPKPKVIYCKPEDDSAWIFQQCSNKTKKQKNTIA